MADERVTDLTLLGSAASNDIIYIIDVSDPTDNPAGSSRGITVDDFLAGVSVTPTNGLEPIGGSFGLGGALTQNTLISGGAFNFEIETTGGNFTVSTGVTGEISLESYGDFTISANTFGTGVLNLTGGVISITSDDNLNIISNSEDVNITAFQDLYLTSQYVTVDPTITSFDGVGSATYLLAGSITTGLIQFGGVNQTGSTLSSGINIGTSTDSYKIRLGIGATATGKTATIEIGSTTAPVGTGKVVISMGRSEAASAITMLVGTGNFTLNGAATSTYTIGAATTTGTYTVGGTAQTGTMTIYGTTAASGNPSLNIGSGATTSTAIMTIRLGVNGEQKNIEIGNTDVASTLILRALGTIGTSGQVLTSNGTTCDWQTPSGGGGTVAVTSGGTGFTSYTVGDMIYADTTTTFAKLVDVSSGSYLRSGGVATAPLWSTYKLLNAGTVNQVLFNSATDTMGQSSAFLYVDSTKQLILNSSVGNAYDPGQAGFFVLPTTGGTLRNGFNPAITIGLNGGGSYPSFQMYSGGSSAFSAMIWQSGSYTSDTGSSRGNIAQHYAYNNGSNKTVYVISSNANIGTTGPSPVIQFLGKQMSFGWGGAASPLALVHLAAGTATANEAALMMTTGSLLTVAQAGAWEYTTPTLYFTNGDLQRQEIPLIQQSRVSTQFDKSANTTLSAVTGLTATLVAGKTYRFEVQLLVNMDSSGECKFSLSGTATATAINYSSIAFNTDASVGSDYAPYKDTALDSSHLGYSSASQQTSVIKIEGTITVNAAGTLTPKFAQETATGTSSVLVGSSMVVTQIA